MSINSSLDLKVQHRGAVGVSAVSGCPPLFERLVYYMLVTELFARVLCEALLNISPVAISQPKLWVLYSLILIEYVISSLSLGQRRFKINISNLVFLLLMTMTIHGLVIATYWGNPVPKTLTDTVPVLVAAFNVACSTAKAASGASTSTGWLSMSSSIASRWSSSAPRR